VTEQRPRIFSRGTWPEASRIADVLRQETIGGILLLIATVAALVAANVGDAYGDLRDATFGFESLHLDLTTGEWAADGLLAIFFFVAGLELKREFVAGDLRNPRRAALPVIAAVGGMAVPALIYVVINLGTDNLAGWAIPTATDIAFALAVLAVISNHLPNALRTFLLTLAVVDDLLAITIIALFYTSDLEIVYLLAAIVPLAAFGALVQARRRTWWLLIPLALVTWGLVHASGVHATVAGVLLAFTVPVIRRDPRPGPGYAEYLEHRLRPLSAAVAVPIFAFFSAGVAIGGWSGFTSAMSDRVTLGIVAGLFLGKTIGVAGATWLMATFTRADLDDDLDWLDVLGLSMLAGVGFTVSLLIGELAFGPGSETDEHVKIGVLVGSVISAGAAAVLLGLRERRYRIIHERDIRDSDADGIPDVYQDNGADET
jgi:NhaA family Na+:H+ antiporter